MTNKNVTILIIIPNQAWGTIPQHLQAINLTSITNEKCKADVSAVPVHDSHLCTFTKDGEGVCSGDSGSPIVLNGEVVGLANWSGRL